MKRDIYSEVTDRIIEQLEKGVIPWKSPYLCEVGFPQNFTTGKAYRGINVFLLGCARFTSPYFLTFLQAKELGGFVKKGERGLPIVKYGTYKPSDDESEVKTDGSKAERRYLKSYTVFNASQIEGIAFPEPTTLPPLTTTEKTAKAREIVARMPNPPTIKDGAAIPCYRPSTDSVHMPETCFFTSEESYFSTLNHELAHSTGHSSRLARKSLLENKGIDASGDARKTYCEEELVAEMAASFLNAQAGIIDTEIENSASYLAGWIDALKSSDRKGWIIKAASEAQKAADYILGIPRE